jgi:hypothetical protein
MFSSRVPIGLPPLHAQQKPKHFTSYRFDAVPQLKTHLFGAAHVFLLTTNDPKVHKNTQENTKEFRMRRRAVLANAAVGLMIQRPTCQASDGSVDELSWLTHRDKNRFFRVEYPVGWEKVTKQGAALLLRDPEDVRAQLGVTVAPVKIGSLSEFGSLHEVGELLLKAEKLKESTVPGGVLLLSERERYGKMSGIRFYDYEYRLQTTRGNRRVLNSVTVENGMLYTLNIQTMETENDDKIGELNPSPYNQSVYGFDVGQGCVE